MINFIYCFVYICKCRCVSSNCKISTQNTQHYTYNLCIFVYVYMWLFFCFIVSYCSFVKICLDSLLITKHPHKLTSSWKLEPVDFKKWILLNIFWWLYWIQNLTKEFNNLIMTGGFIHDFTTFATLNKFENHDIDPKCLRDSTIIWAESCLMWHSLHLNYI